MRSLTDPAGLDCSILAQTAALRPGRPGVRMAMSGVSPTSSSTFSASRSGGAEERSGIVMQLISSTVTPAGGSEADCVIEVMRGSDDAQALHAVHPPIDLHADTLMWSRWLGYDVLNGHHAPLWRAALGGHVDVPRMRDGGIGAQFFSLVSLPIGPYEGGLRSRSTNKSTFLTSRPARSAGYAPCPHRR